MYEINPLPKIFQISISLIGETVTIWRSCEILKEWVWLDFREIWPRDPGISDWTCLTGHNLSVVAVWQSLLHLGRVDLANSYCFSGMLHKKLKFRFCWENVSNLHSTEMETWDYLSISHFSSLYEKLCIVIFKF